MQESVKSNTTNHMIDHNKEHCSVLFETQCKVYREIFFIFPFKIDLTGNVLMIGHTAHNYYAKFKVVKLFGG